MEKRYFLNQSNTKWISIGIKPLSLDAFYADVMLHGEKMKPLCLGGIDGFLNLCQILRNFDEFKFAYPGTAGNYEEIGGKQLAINITKKNFGANICFQIENINGECCYIAMSSIMEMLKIESLLIAAMKNYNGMVSDVATKFNSLICKSSSDLSAVLIDVEKSGDLLTIEIIANFNDFFKMCVEGNKNGNLISASCNTVHTAAKATPTTRKAAAGRKRSAATATEISKKKAKEKQIQSPPPTANSQSPTADNDSAPKTAANNDSPPNVELKNVEAIIAEEANAKEAGAELVNTIESNALANEHNYYLHEEDSFESGSEIGE